MFMFLIKADKNKQTEHRWQNPKVQKHQAIDTCCVEEKNMNRYKYNCSFMQSRQMYNISQPTHLKIDKSLWNVFKQEHILLQFVSTVQLKGNYYKNHLKDMIPRTLKIWRVIIFIFSNFKNTCSFNNSIKFCLWVKACVNIKHRDNSLFNY